MRRYAGRGAGRSLAAVLEGIPARLVEVSFVGAPPTRAVERASGVSEVEVVGPVLRCIVSGSFQPFIEALRGHEVLSLTSMPLPSTTFNGGQ